MLCFLACGLELWIEHEHSPGGRLLLTIDCNIASLTQVG